MIDRGELPSERGGARRVRIRQSQLDSFLAAGQSGPQFQQSDPWQAVSEAAGRVAAAVRANDRNALDRALSSLARAAQEMPAQGEASDGEPARTTDRCVKVRGSRRATSCSTRLLR
jgi:hypothetical protein